MTTTVRRVLLAASALVLAGVMTLLAAITLGGPSDPGTAAVTDSSRTRAGTAAGRGASDVASLQQRLRRLPKDYRSWSALALAYVEQGRVTADPAYYDKADRAVRRAAALAPDDSVMLTARAYLAAARHDFRAALDAAQQAVAANPASAAALAIRADALTELGRYEQARAAALRADDIEPGPSTYARLSYAAELRGDLAEARRLMTLSRDAAGTSAPAYAFASYHLGELARTVGDLAQAAKHYRAALSADPTYAPALIGRARMAVARGDTQSALTDYETVVARFPLPEYVVELGELYLALGREEEAAGQFTVAETSAKIAAASGVVTNLETALYEADHGSPTKALAAARAEWAARQSIYSADALGWALHVAGRDAEALRYLRLANKLGTRDARLLFHLGAVEAALGRDAAARKHLTASLAIDNGVAPWREASAKQLLAGLDGGSGSSGGAR